MPNKFDKNVVLAIVRESILEDGSFAKEIIDCVSLAVKEYAERQRDWTSHYATILTLLVEEISKKDPSILSHCGNFSQDQVLAIVEKHYGGTPGWEKLSSKLNYNKPDSLGGMANYI